jgi:hypothetical protein
MWNRHASTGLGSIAPLVALAFPLAEVLLSICRRFLRNRPIFGADRNHIHHRLLSMGFSQRSTALTLYGVSALAALLAVLQTMLRPKFATVCLLVLIGTAYLGFRWLRYPEFGVLRRFVFGGEFRSALRTKIYLKEYQDCMISANTTEECWDALRAACRQAQFNYIALRLGGQSFEDELKPDDQTKLLHIPLSPSDSVTFGRDSNNPELGMLIGPFVEALQLKLAVSATARGKLTTIAKQPSGLKANNAAVGG